MEREHITWEAPEYLHEEKTSDWFWTVGIIGVCLSVVAIILGNTLFAALIFLCTLALLLQSLKQPRVLTFSIDVRGLFIGPRLYPFDSLESFWLNDDTTSTNLLVKSQRLLMPLIVLHIPDDVDVQKVHDMLSKHLPEEELHEPFFEHIMHRLGF